MTWTTRSISSAGARAGAVPAACAAAMTEPYLVTVIRQIAGLEARDALSPDETARLNMYRRWLARHYPDVSAALAREYRTMAMAGTPLS